MLRQIFASLDQWVEEQNAEALNEGLLSLKKCEFRVVGQTALLEAKLDLEIAATADVDAVNNAEAAVLIKLNEILMIEGLEYDQLSNEIWMPAETRYQEVYRGRWVTVLLALPEFVMASKAKMAMQKNKPLLQQYVALGPPKIFFTLCERYHIDLDELVRV